MRDCQEHGPVRVAGAAGCGRCAAAHRRAASRRACSCFGGGSAPGGHRRGPRPTGIGRRRPRRPPRPRQGSPPLPPELATVGSAARRRCRAAGRPASSPWRRHHGPTRPRAARSSGRRRSHSTRRRTAWRAPPSCRESWPRSTPRRTKGHPSCRATRRAGCRQSTRRAADGTRAARGCRAPLPGS